MKLAPKTQAAFTFVELLVVLVIVVILAGMIPMNSSHSKARATRIYCVSNLKQIGTGYRMFANDHDDLFPNEVTTNNDSFAGMRSAADSFNRLDITNQSLSTKLFICPADLNRKQATKVNMLGSSNLSYFSCLNASPTNPNMFLAGDRNVTLNGASLLAFTVQTNDSLGWTAELHNMAGNVGLADGSVQQVTSNRLNAQLGVSGAVHRLSLP